MNGFPETAKIVLTVASVLAIGFCLVPPSWLQKLLDWWAFVKNPRNVLCTVCIAAGIIYGGSKSNVIVPTQKTASVRQTNATVTDPVSKSIEYYQSSVTTNDIDVALFGGTVTNKFSFTAGQFLYAYDATASAGAYQNPTNNPLWVRPNSYSNWTSSVLADSWTPDSSNAAVIATLPGGKSPAHYAQVFIGPEEYLPAIIVDVTGGIEITAVAITSKTVDIVFSGNDERLRTGAHDYMLQVRRYANGTLSDWTTVGTCSCAAGAYTGSFHLVGYTVGEYREYRVVSDVEVTE